MILDRFSDKIVYSYSTRRGGVSEGKYESMNLSNSMGDDPERVRENYIIWLRENGVCIDDVVSLKQAHCDRIFRADRSHRGSGPIEGRLADSFGNAFFDGMVTDVPGVALVTGHADCAPIYLYDAANIAVGLVHAGWRGTSMEIAAKALLTMVREYGTDPRDVYAFVGPCIHIAAFECGRDVIDAVDAMSFDTSPYYYQDDETGKYHASIPDLNRASLVAAGVPPEQIELSDECTYELADKYFSHRRQGVERGGQAALLMIKSRTP